MLEWLLYILLVVIIYLVFTLALYFHGARKYILSKPTFNPGKYALPDGSTVIEIVPREKENIIAINGRIGFCFSHVGRFNGPEIKNRTRKEKELFTKHVYDDGEAGNVISIKKERSGVPSSVMPVA